MTQILPLDRLHERHPGLTRSISDAYIEAAGVCFDRHHTPPLELVVEAQGHTLGAAVNWARPDDQIRGAWANDIDATEFGAYGVALAAVELAIGLVAIRRAETRTGADYYVAPPGAPADDLEDWRRLEVSGTDKGNEAAIQSRLREKQQQAMKGNSNLPALAAVVGFECKVVAIGAVDQP